MLLSPFFDVLPPEDRASLARVSVLKSLKRGKVLWRAGERVEHIAAVRNGLLCVTVDMNGDDEVLCGVLRKDDTLLLGLERGLPCPMAVRALTACDVTLVPFEAVEPLFRTHPKAVNYAYRTYVERLYGQRFLGAVLLNATIEKRLAYAYWSMSTVDREGRRVLESKVSQADIGKLIGTSREEVSRRSALLEQSHYISSEDGVLVLSESLPLLFLSETQVPAFLAAEFGIS